MPGGIGSWLPSLAWATLPQGWQLPSLPAFTTRHWQQRLLRYLIRRTLGGVLRLPDDDIENSTFLDADLASGSLRLRDVELDEGAINELLRQQLSSSGVSGTLKSGRIASIEVLVGGTTASPQCGTANASAFSATERLFSAPVSINITGLTLDFRLDALPASPGGEQPASPGHGHAHEATAGVMDLGASIHYIASDFVEGTSSPASPSESYTADASQSISLPGGFEDRSGSPDNAAQGQAQETQVGIVAKIVETLLARLQLSVSDVTVKLSLAGQCDFELVIQRLSSLANTTQKGNLNTATRTLVLSGFDVCYLSSTAEEDHQAEDKGRKAYASTSDDSASTGSSDDLAMSVAVQDLRQSLVQETDLRKTKSNDLEQSFTSDDTGGHSIYEDFDASVNPVDEVARPLEDSAEKQQLRARRRYRIFGLFSDVISTDSRPSDVTVHIITTAFAPVPLGAASSPSFGRASPVTRIEMQAPFVAAFVNFEMVDSCLSFFRSVQAPSLSTARDDASDSSRATPPSLVLHSKIQGFKLFTNLGLETPSLSKLVKMDTSGCRSPLVYLFFDKLELAHRTESSDGKLTIQDFGLAIRPQGRAAYHPIVLPDPGLLWLYDVEATAVKARTPQEGDWGRATYSSLQEWRTHLPNNAASMSASTRLPMLKDAVASRWTSANIEVNMQPIQIWLDTELILESLQAMEAALARRTLRYSPISHTGAASLGTEGRQLSSRHLSLTVPCARINFRCPSLPKEVQSAGQLRGGLVSIDVHDLVAKRASANGTRPSRCDASQLVMSNVFVHASTRDLRYRSCLLKIASGSRKHAVIVTLDQSLEKKPEQSQMHVSVTQVTAWLDKRAASAVQYLADDAGQTLARINSLVSSILSAFRSPQIGQSVPSAPIRSDATSLAPNESDSLSIELLEGKASLDLSGRHASASRSCDITLRQALVRVGTGTKRRNELAFILQLAGIDVVDSITDAERSSTRPLFQCYQPPQAGCLHLRLTSSTDQNLAKSSRLKCRLHGLEVVLSPDLTILEDVAQCLKTPPGAFSDVEPTQSTGITVELQECRLRVFPLSLPSSVVLHVQSLRFRTLLSLKASVQQYHLDMTGLQLWVIDVRSQDPRTMKSLKNAGYAQLLTQQGFSMRAAVAQPSKTTTILLQKVDGTCIATCPDTLLTLSAFLSDCALPAKGTPTEEGAAASDLSASIMLSRPSHAIPWTIKEQSTAGQYEVVSDVDGDSIAVHSRTMKVLVDHEWLNQARRPSSKRTASPAFTLRARLTTFKLSLYEGYDFERTQCHIKRTVKATRRKLEKIRQLLAEGQVPDQTMQEAADTLLQSVFLPPRSSIPQDKEDEDASNTGQDVFRRIVAFDDELDQEDDHLKESLATWETLVNEAAANKRLVASPSSASRPAMSSRRLTRPKSSAIDICVIDPEIKFTAYSVGSGLVSKISIQVANFNILDNMETSTWHKFVTELRPRDGGITRPTGSNMVNLKLQMYRAGPSSGPEADLFLRVAPLRLHVDQDALDFLKAFFAFKIDAPQALQQPHPPCSWTPPTSSEAKDNAGFIQRVEICAIKIKLDYKPKRVDYNALRQGRAIEMMNFFHFEASEMVLRHLVLEGVQDWAKVGDMLQDIWTPDVKANQLADFLSGINPIRSVVNVGQGVADLLLLPVAQYKKDGRVGRGLQRGGAKFAKSTAMEAINIGARLATGTQVILEHAESILGGRIGDLHSRENVPVSHGRSPSTPATERHGTSDWLLTATDDDVNEAERSSRRSEAVSRFAQQPDDVGSGLQTAYRSLSGNVRSAAETILAVPMEVYERSNEGPVRTVVRAVPIAVLRPMIGASEAVSKTLLGLRNTLDPGIKGENQDKYKRRSHTS